MKESKREILIVKIGAIGDMVMCLPLIQYIKKNEPESRITWICGKTIAPVLEKIPQIDRLIILNDQNLFNKNPFKIGFELLKVWKNLTFNKFDICLYFYYSSFYKLLLTPCFIKEYRRFSRGSNERNIPVPGRHHTMEYISTFAKKEGPYQFEIEYPYVELNDEKQKYSKEISKSNTVFLSPGGAKNLVREDVLRRWPIENYVKLSQKLIENGFTVVIIGGPNDAYISTYFEKSTVINFIGKCNLMETIGLLSNGLLLITHDSGPLHLADLANIPSIGLFGPTSPYYFRSLHTLSKYIWGGQNLACRPCYDGKGYENCKNNMCMSDITVENVFQLFLEYTNQNLVKK